MIGNKIKIGIKAKLCFVICILLSVTCIGMGWGGFFAASKSLQNSIEQSLPSIATESAHYISIRMEIYKSEIEGVANRNAIRSMQWHDKQRPDLQKEKERLGFLGIGIVLPDGTANYSNGSTAKLGDRNYVKQAFAGKTFLSDVIISRVTNKPVIMLSTPIKSEKGEVVAALIARLDGYVLSEITDDIKYGVNGYSYIINDKGALIAHKNREFVLKARNFYEEGKTESKFKLLSNMMHRMISGETGYEGYWFLGKDRLFGYAPISGTNWSIAVGAEKDEVYADIYSLKTIFLLLGFILITIGIIVAVFFATRITSPIKLLADAMEEVKQTADFSKRVEVKSDDEVGVVSDAFNSLLEAMQQAIAAANATLSKVSEGDFSQKVTLNVTGDLDKLKQGINHSVENIQTTMAALNELLEALANGNFGKRIDVNLKGEFKHSADAALDSMMTIDTAMKSINDVMASVAQADFNSRVDVNLKGDLETLKSNINRSLDVVMQGIKDTTDITVALADGDLTKRINADHPGQFGVLTNALNKTMDNLSQVVKNIVQASDIVASASNEIANGNTDMSKRTEEQATSLEETASSMEELTSTVKQNADNAKQANQLAIGARQTADHGGSVVEQAINAMEEINTSSNKIADIIGVIDEIAFQTNLLALNASVEAARAGEQGRGFAVVATEVRNLAQRSAAAAKEIKDLIQDSVGKVKVGSELVEKSGETLGEIVDEVKKVGDMISEIAAASQEQTAGISQVNQALTNMDSITQCNAALAEEASANSENLNEQASSMARMMSFFKLIK